LGICRPAAANSLLDSHLPCRVGRLAAQHSVYSGGGFFPAGGTNSSAGTRIWRAAVCFGAQRDRRSDRPAVSLERELAGDQLPGTKFVDWVRLLRGACDQARRSSVLALVRRRCWNRAAGEVFDRFVWFWDGCWALADRAAPRFLESVALDRRGCCFFDFPA